MVGAAIFMYNKKKSQFFIYIVFIFMIFSSPLFIRKKPNTQIHFARLFTKLLDTMADPNIEACSRAEEIEMVERAEEVREEEVNTDESMVEKWTVLNANTEQSDNESSQSQETQENWVIVNRDAASKNDDVLPKDNNVVSKDDVLPKDNNVVTKDDDLSNNCDGISRVEDNFDGSDGSDSISVITENSDIDSNNRISQVNDSFQINNTFRDRSRLLRLERQRNARSCLIACALGLLSIIGSLFYHPFTVPEAFQDSNGIDRESFKMATYNIDNIYKELPQVKAMLNEIRAHISDDAKVRNNFLVQLSEIIDSSNKMSNKPIMADKESFNSNLYSLDQLQVSLHVLSSLAFIDDNIPLKNEMTKTLDTVSDTKAFYETLISFNNTQNNSAVSEFLQSGNDIIRITSEQLFSDLVEKMNKVMLNVHKKYAKVGQKLSKKLCHLKNILPNDELLKQLTENNQLFKNYDKSCFSNQNNLKKLNNERSRIESANNPKRQIRKADDGVLQYTKRNKKNFQNNRENSLKNDGNGMQSINNSTTANSKKIKLNVDNNYIIKIKEKLYEVLSSLEDIQSDPSKLEQVTKNCGKKNKKSINRCIKKNDYVQSDTCPFFELNKWPEFDNDVITSNTVPDLATESCDVYANSKHKVNSTKTVLDHGSSANVLAEEKNGSKQENDFESKHSTKKPLNNKSACRIRMQRGMNKERDVPPQNKIKNHIPKDTFNHESEQSSFNKRTNQDDKSYIFEKDNIYRSNARKKQWQSDASDWYFQRADSRKNARKDVEYQRNWYFQRADSRKNARKDVEYQRNWYFQRVDSRKNARNCAECRQNSKRLRRKKCHPCRIVDIWNSFVHDYNKFLRSILEENVI